MNNSQEKNGVPELNDADASRMLGNIFRACSVTPNAVPFSLLKSWGNYRRTDFIICKALSVVLLLALLVLPFFFIPASVDIQPPKGLSSDSATIDLAIDSLLPVTNVDAQLNGQDLQVVQVKYNAYTVDVTDNGNLQIAVTLINGRSSHFSYEVDSIEKDKASPEFVSSNLSGEELNIYVADAVSGVDFQGAYAVDEGGETIVPLRYDEAAGLIVFPYHKENLNIFIPDKKGNVLQAVVTYDGPRSD